MVRYHIRVNVGNENKTIQYHFFHKNGADLTDSDLRDSTISGCMIYSDPGSARINIEDYIKNKM